MKTKTKRSICGYISGFGFLLLLGAVGGMELGGAIGTGLLLSMIGLTLFLGGAYKGGYLGGTHGNR